MAGQEIKPGQRIRVLQEIDRREGNWTHGLVGMVLSVRAEKTGSWHAHGKSGKLWLSRIRLQKEGGEITTIVVDQHTRLEVLSDAPSS
jgi:uncharacterized protein YwbE